MTINTTDKKYNSNVEFRKIGKKEPKWLYNFRKNNWLDFDSMSLPDRVTHLWKYTDPAQFIPESPYEAMNVMPSADEKAKKPILESNYSGYGYNRPDFMTTAVIDESLAENGVIFKNLYSAVSEDTDIVGNYLGHLIDSSFGKLEAMNAALWNSGLFLYIPDNIMVEKPIRLQRHPAGPATFLRLLVVVGKNSKVTIIDDYSGKCRINDALINSVAEIFVGDDSDVRYANIQRFGGGCKSHITQRGRIGNDARLHSIYAGLGGSVSKVNAGTVLAGRGAESKMSGIVFAADRRHFDYHTRHHHVSGDTHSDIDFRMILKDKTVSAYTGLIKIDEDAENSEAYQINRNLLLNKGAKAESIPELEILCDQVRCSHGSTTGPIDPQMLFYLKSRGISHNEAVKTVITGFVEPTLAQVPEELAGIMGDLIERRLEE